MTTTQHLTTRSNDLPYHLVEERGDTGLTIAGFSVSDLASHYGTPLYLIDSSILSHQLRVLSTTFPAPGFRLFYSIKANPSISIIKRCLEAGLGLDLCSPGDVHLAFAAGASPDLLSYTGVGLTDQDISTLVQQSVHVNLDSLSEIRRFARVAAGQTAGIRIAPGIEAGFHAHCRAGEWGGKFGIAPNDLPQAIQILHSASCNLGALHVHLGSSIDSARPYLAALDLLLALANEISDVTAINLGGGLAARYHPDDPLFPLAELRDGISERLSCFQSATGRRLTVALEPGEFAVAEAGYLLCRVLVTKHWKNEEGVVDAAITDASMNLMPAHSLYGTYFHIYVDSEAGRQDGQLTYDVYGCTNQTGDRLAHQRTLPHLREGVLLLLRNGGAYAYSRSTQFNERPRAGEVWLEGPEARMTRAPESIEELRDGQQLGIRQ